MEQEKNLLVKIVAPDDNEPAAKLESFIAEEDAAVCAGIDVLLATNERFFRCVSHAIAHTMAKTDKANQKEYLAAIAKEADEVRKLYYSEDKEASSSDAMPKYN